MARAISSLSLPAKFTQMLYLYVASSIGGCLVDLFLKDTYFAKQLYNTCELAMRLKSSLL